MLDPPGGVEGSFRGLSACGPGFRVSMPGWRPGPGRGRPGLPPRRPPANRLGAREAANAARLVSRTPPPPQPRGSVAR